MKRKKSILVYGLILLIIAFIMTFNKKRVDPQLENSFRDGAENSENSQEKNDKSKSDREQSSYKNHAENTSNTIRYIASELHFSPINADSIAIPKYQFGGAGTRGLIRDQDNNVIFRASNENPVYAITISPNDELIWISGADIKSYIINNKGEEIASLPIKPPGKNMLRFGKWVWLDNNRLLGDSGVQKYDEKGKLVTCCGGENVSETRFYIYDIRTGHMETMKVPDRMQNKVVQIGKVLKSGEIQLGHDKDDFSWFKVDESK